MSRDSGHPELVSTSTDILDRKLSRRRLIGTGAVGAAGVLAGAATGSAAMAVPAPIPEGRVVTTQDGGKEYHSGWPYDMPPTGHFNSYVADGILNPPNIYGDFALLPLGLYYWEAQEWMPVLATEWAFDSDTTFRVTLRQGAKWTDGTEFTAADVIGTFTVWWLQSNTAWQYIKSITATDDYTVVFTLKRPATVVERYVIRASPRPASVYKEFIDEIDALRVAGKTQDDPEARQLLDRLNQFRPETLVWNGPYFVDVDSITSSRLDMVRNETAWNADRAVFDRLVLYNGSVDAVVLTKEIDYATHAFPIATEQEMTKLGIRIVRPPIYSGPSILFNYAKVGGVFGDKRARQALAHAVDRGRNGQVALGQSGVAVKYMSGMSDLLVPKWVEEADIPTLNTYEYDVAKAAELLQQAGWTKDGDIWKTPDGEDAAFELLAPAEFIDWIAGAQDLVDQLNDFGIQLELRGITSTQQPIDVNKGNFELAIRGWGSSTNPHPHYSFAQALFTHNTLAKNDGGKGMDYPLIQTTDVAGDVDLQELTIGCAEGLDESAQKAQVTTIAQVFNELLPVVPMWERYGNNVALEGVRVKAWPTDDDPILKNSPYADGIPTMLLFEGKLEAV